MKTLLLSWLMLAGLVTHGQPSDSTAWEFSAEGMFYYFPGEESLFLPVLRADRGKLHLEARYNYEDLRTVSGWVGYNFEGSAGKIDYVFTPMAGVAGGRTKGVAAGLEFTVTLGKFELSSESEYLWDRAGSEYNFFYSWTDVTFSPKDWWWVGISGQRTKLYQTETDIQRGLILGASAGAWDFSGYFYNLGLDAPFFLFDVVFSF
jgi:hypothetical protein